MRWRLMDTLIIVHAVVGTIAYFCLTGNPDAIKYKLGVTGPYHRIAELYFEDQAALQAALGSDEGKATARDYGQIAPSGSRMFIAAVDDK